MEELVARGLVALLAGAVAIFIMVTGRKSKDYLLSVSGAAMFAVTLGMMALPLPG